MHEREMKYTRQQQKLPTRSHIPCVTDPSEETVEILRRNTKANHYTKSKHNNNEQIIKEMEKVQ